MKRLKTKELWGLKSLCGTILWGLKWIFQSNLECTICILALKYEKCYMYNIFTTLLQQILSGKLLRVIIDEAKKSFQL